VVLAQMKVLVTRLAVVETALLGKTIATHQLQGIAHKVFIQSMPGRFDRRMKLGGRKVLLGLQKHLQDKDTHFKAIDMVLLEQFDELLFLLGMDTLLHGRHREPWHPSRVLAVNR
jgi:hypothetical protein